MFRDTRFLDFGRPRVGGRYERRPRPLSLDIEGPSVCRRLLQMASMNVSGTKEAGGGMCSDSSLATSSVICTGIASAPRLSNTRVRCLPFTNPRVEALARRSHPYEIRGIGNRPMCVLIQLPSSLKFDPADVRSFVERLRASFDGDVVCEPRHASWFTAEVDAFLVEHRIARVAADPSLIRLPVLRAAGTVWSTTGCMGRPRCTTRRTRTRSSRQPPRLLRTMRVLDG